MKESKNRVQWCMPAILAIQEGEEDQKFQGRLSFRVSPRPIG